MTHTDAQATPAGPAAPATGTGTGGQSARLLTPLTAVVAVLLLACFAPYLGWMWDVWMRSPYYGHGPLIPLVSAYLVYSRRRELRQAQGGHHLWGLPIVILGLLVYAVAIYLNVNFPQGFALIAVVGGLTLLLFGWERARTLAFPILYLSFMVPLDRLLVTRFSSPMQLGGAAVAGGVVRLLGLPVTVHGTTIILPEYTFEVAQACSGLKSTIAMSALAALFAYLVVAPLWQRLVLCVSGVPVALLANSARIVFTLILGRAFGVAAAEGFFHTFSGLIVFVLALTGLFGVAKVLRCDSMRADIW